VNAAVNDVATRAFHVPWASTLAQIPRDRSVITPTKAPKPRIATVKAGSPSMEPYQPTITPGTWYSHQIAVTTKVAGMNVNRRRVKGHRKPRQPISSPAAKMQADPMPKTEPMNAAPSRAASTAMSPAWAAIQ
jgi:hypothetical protein